MAAKTQRRGRRRRRNRRKRGFASWSIGKKIGLILGCTLLVVLAAGFVIVASKINKIETTELDIDKLNISAQTEEETETGYLNVALFGLDSRDGTLGKGNRSDTMMIASLNKATGEIKLVSIYRDTLLELDDGSYNKANAAYSFGGPEGAISLINRNMDMNIEKYVAVNFNALVDVIDAVGGLDIEMTYEEVCHMNNYCVETSKVTGKDYTKIEPEVAGTYHLNGVQAVSYSRIRYTAGGDPERTQRQRLVINKIAEKAQDMSLSMLNRLIDSVFPQISTNFTLTEMITYAKDIMDYKLGESMGFPVDCTYDMLNEVGSVAVADTLTSNLEEVHQFLFGNSAYQPSDTVLAIQDNIEWRVATDYEDDSDEEYWENEDTGDWEEETGDWAAGAEDTGSWDTSTEDTGTGGADVDDTGGDGSVEDDTGGSTGSADEVGGDFVEEETEIVQ